MKKDILTFNDNDFKHKFVEVSKVELIFAKHRLEYLKSIEEFIKKACVRKKIEYLVDYNKCLMEVRTTDETRDPYIIIKANDFIGLLSKGVPLECAHTVLEDDVFCEIIPVKIICSNKKVFERRKNRICNPKILKAIELLTKCKIFISGKSACVVGNYKGLNNAKNILIKCFENIHPVYEIKKLITKNKLNEEGKEGDWDRYMIKIKKTHSSKKKNRKVENKEKNTVEADVKPSALETGEYYANKKNKEKHDEMEIKDDKFEE